MNFLDIFTNINNENSQTLVQQWSQFLVAQNFDFSALKNINMASDCPIITDHQQNKFSIDFNNNKSNYHKKKSGLKNELISKALGAGRLGLKVLDLSAGLGIDAVFLAQLGYQVTAIERNPLIYLCLQRARQLAPDLNVEFVFADAKTYLQQAAHFDVVYFDPMFPEKTKSALPRQEMVFFKALVGADEDAAELLQQVLKLKNIKRVVVKRPIKAKALAEKVAGAVDGKLIRYDIYGVNK